jgi:hypothetical protein
MLKKEYLLRVSENRVLRKIYRPEMDEIIGDWGRLHSEELHDLYSSKILFGYEIKTNMMGVLCGTYGEKKKCV